MPEHLLIQGIYNFRLNTLEIWGFNTPAYILLHSANFIKYRPVTIGL